MVCVRVRVRVLCGVVCDARGEALCERQARWPPEAGMRGRGVHPCFLAAGKIRLADFRSLWPLSHGRLVRLPCSTASAVLKAAAAATLAIVACVNGWSLTAAVTVLPNGCHTEACGRRSDKAGTAQAVLSCGRQPPMYNSVRSSHICDSGRRLVVQLRPG